MAATLDPEKNFFAFQGIEFDEPTFKNEDGLRKQYETMLTDLAVETAKAANSHKEAFRFLVYSMIRIISEACIIARSKHDDTE